MVNISCAFVQPGSVIVISSCRALYNYYKLCLQYNYRLFNRLAIVITTRSRGEIRFSVKCYSVRSVLTEVGCDDFKFKNHEQKFLIIICVSITHDSKRYNSGCLGEVLKLLTHDDTCIYYFILCLRTKLVFCVRNLMCLFLSLQRPSLPVRLTAVSPSQTTKQTKT